MLTMSWRRFFVLVQGLSRESVFVNITASKEHEEQYKPRIIRDPDEIRAAVQQWAR